MGLFFKKNQRSFSGEEIREYVRNDFAGTNAPGTSARNLPEGAAADSVYEVIHEMICHGSPDDYCCAFQFFEFIYTSGSIIPGQAWENLLECIRSRGLVDEMFYSGMSMEKYDMVLDFLPYTSADRASVKEYLFRYLNKYPALAYNFFERYIELNENHFDKDLYDSLPSDGENLFFLKLLFAKLPAADEFSSMEMLRALEPSCPSCYRKFFEKDVLWQQKFEQAEDYDSVFTFAAAFLVDLVDSRYTNEDFISSVKECLDSQEIRSLA